ncbi:MAG: hypothetical protein H6R32_563 [Candidatus Aminicenantes bacterium]|jgi:hypothetical protein|nr:hypothetical protein [Candidatus Aminicenantes bacterium]
MGTWSAHPRQRAAACEDLVPSEIKKGPVPKDEPLIKRESKNYFLTGGTTTW